MGLSVGSYVAHNALSETMGVRMGGFMRELRRGPHIVKIYLEYV